MTRLLLLATACAAFTGCSRGTSTPAPNAARHVANAETTSAAAALDGLDARKPVPLLPIMANHQKQNMRDHLAAVQEIVAALSTDDFAGAEQAAGRIGFSAQMSQMCTHMGAGAPDFTEQALAFHHTADGVAAAARDRDRGRALSELSATLKACTGCHATWRQQVVDEATWQRLTATAPPSHDAPH
jgi:hypothetical protein